MFVACDVGGVCGVWHDSAPLIKCLMQAEPEGGRVPVGCMLPTTEDSQCGRHCYGYGKNLRYFFSVAIGAFEL